MCAYFNLLDVVEPHRDIGAAGEIVAIHQHDAEGRKRQQKMFPQRHTAHQTFLCSQDIGKMALHTTTSAVKKTSNITTADTDTEFEAECLLNMVSESYLGCGEPEHILRLCITLVELLKTMCMQTARQTRALYCIARRPALDVHQNQHTNRKGTSTRVCV